MKILKYFVVLTTLFASTIFSAGSVVAAIPPVIMFFIMQKQFIQGLTFGAVKG